MTIRIIRNRDLIRTPWKNGGGTTAEVAVEPAGADFEAFDWRISMADVASEGPFSAFPGIDRTLALVDGMALDLDVDGIVHRLDATSPVLSFAGETLVRATLPAGPIRDFNVMTRRSRFGHRMRLVRPGNQAIDLRATTIAVVALEDATQLTIDDLPYRLDRLDVLISTSAQPGIVAGRLIFVIELMAAMMDDHPKLVL